MSGRQGGGRRGGRDNSSKDNDIELDYLNRVLESLRKAKELNDEQARLGQEILALEEEIKTSSTHKARSGSTPDQHRRLDDLYRKKLRNAEAEKKIHDEEDIANNLAILATMRSTDEPAPRNAGHGPKSSRSKSHQQQQQQQHNHRPIIESDVSADSPGVSPAETTASSHHRLEVLKRKQPNHAQRSSSVVSSGRGPTGGAPVVKDTSAVPASKDSLTTSKADQELHKGLMAEKAGTLTVGTEVFYKYSRTPLDDVGVGIHCMIKKIHADRNPIIYDVQDPDPDPSGKQNVHKATAKDLYPIPPPSKGNDDTKGVVFEKGATVYARYPDTDTFYRAKVVRGLKGGEYTLRFEGEEDDKEQGVERRFVLDTRMR
ncbi:hypothetical protein H2198_005802 [Neophaeococcomyces mojaviensis]|uniref:Uncharacterized protein n=1 Tax=Neophaeococcomyces mojaviensis TaxID=3383035 RepID=A0ACC3A4K0_9EURO|nr:hypothetical protein H2198_005802 [Knufia sp. JES_112]